MCWQYIVTASESRVLIEQYEAVTVEIKPETGQI